MTDESNEGENDGGDSGGQNQGGEDSGNGWTDTTEIGTRGEPNPPDTA